MKKLQFQPIPLKQWLLSSSLIQINGYIIKLKNSFFDFIIQTFSNKKRKPKLQYNIYILYIADIYVLKTIY